MTDYPDSELVGKGPCSDCGSSDACATYDDGHTHCFSCGVTKPGDGSAIAHKPRLAAGLIEGGEFEALVKRGITEEACRKFGYRVGRDKRGAKVQIAEYRDDDGNIVAQKIRDSAKKFAFLGEPKGVQLFGQHIWRGTGRRIVVTEGEIDALSVGMAFGLTWDVVSLPNGASHAAKAIKNSLQFLQGYDEVVLWFDGDEPGREAAAACAPLFAPGRCKVASHPVLKDANEVLLAEGIKAVCNVVFNAKIFRPDGIVTLDEIEARVMADPEMGRPWPFAGLSEVTFGRRLGDVIGLGAGTGIGKTDFFTECISHDVMSLGITTGVIYLEQNVAETGKRIAGKIAGKRFHVPDGSWTKPELLTAWQSLKATGKLHLYDSFGALDWETVKAKIRYMVVSLGCEHIYLDHMTALAAAEDDERKALEKIMAEAASMAQELRFVLHYVSHLATPEGKPHEEGGRVMIRNFKGSRALGYWSHFMLGMERDQSDQSEAGRITTLRVLKDRYTGQATGKTFGLAYDATTGRMSECALPSDNDPMTTPEPDDDVPF